MTQSRAPAPPSWPLCLLLLCLCLLVKRVRRPRALPHTGHPPAALPAYGHSVLELLSAKMHRAGTEFLGSFKIGGPGPLLLPPLLPDHTHSVQLLIDLPEQLGRGLLQGASLELTPAAALPHPGVSSDTPWAPHQGPLQGGAPVTHGSMNLVVFQGESVSPECSPT